MSAPDETGHSACREGTTAKSHFLPSDADFGGRSIARLAKINERLKLGMLGRALNGDLWVSGTAAANRPLTILGSIRD